MLTEFEFGYDLTSLHTFFQDSRIREVIHFIEAGFSNIQDLYTKQPDSEQAFMGLTNANPTFGSNP